MNTECPICLDELLEKDSMLWPECMHKVHTWCALTAAQYDARCPMCRGQSSSISFRQSESDDEDDEEDSEDDLWERLEENLKKYESDVKRYKARRYRIIRKNETLRNLQDKLNDAQKQFKNRDKQLDKEWSDWQRIGWTQNERIIELKQMRQRTMRKISYLTKRIDKRVTECIGSPPQQISFFVPHQDEDDDDED